MREDRAPIRMIHNYIGEGVLLGPLRVTKKFQYFILKNSFDLIFVGISNRRKEKFLYMFFDKNILIYSTLASAPSLGRLNPFCPVLRRLGALRANPQPQRHCAIAETKADQHIQ